MEGRDNGSQRHRAYFFTASNYKRSRDFYRELLPFLGLTPVIDTETTYYCVGGRTAVGISAPSAGHEGGGIRAEACRFASSLLPRPRARRHRRAATAFSRRSVPRSSARRVRITGARVLLILFKIRWYPARAQSCAGEGDVGVGATQLRKMGGATLPADSLYEVIGGSCTHASRGKRCIGVGSLYRQT